MRPVMPDVGGDPTSEYVAELFWSIRIQAEIGERYAMLGDGLGLDYTTRKIDAYLQVLKPSVADLRTLLRAPYRETAHGR